MPKRTHSKVSWTAVEDALEQNTPASLLVAVIEAEKILRQMLAQNRVPGRNTYAKLNNIKTIFNDFDKLVAARKTYFKIITEPKIELDLDDAEDILSTYYQAVIDLSEKPEAQLNFLQRINLWISNYIKEPKKRAKQVGFGLLAFFILVAILDRTRGGQAIVRGILTVADFLISWTMLLILIIGVVIVIVIITIIYLEKRKKTNIEIEE